MTRFNELQRIEKAIENRDLNELQWAESYAQMRIDTAYTTHTKKIGKIARKEWTKRLQHIQATIALLDDDLYDRWIVSIFDRDLKKGEWYFDIEGEPIDVPDLVLANYLIKLNNSLPEIMATYNDWQVSRGLHYFYSPNYSNCAYEMMHSSIPSETKQLAILSIKKLYSDCFESKCEPTLGYLSETGGVFNGFCYILWDDTPISYLCEDIPDGEDIINSVFETLEYALTLNNIACIESALHGLGHMVYDYPKAADIIQAFINNSRKMDPRVMKYAEAAKTGYIN